MPSPKRFSYYARLSTAQRRVYEKSDAVHVIHVPSPGALEALVAALERALVEGKRPRVTRAATELCDALFRQLHAPPARVRVREVRPQIRDGELHGLYTFADGRETPLIEVWMRTAAHGHVVRFRTFMRILMHEVLHHLDVTLLELTESFHTAGFFRRESSLVRQLLPRPRTAKPPKKTSKEAKASRVARQLSLFGAG